MRENRVTETLSEQEQSELHRCESVVEKGINTVVEVGNALTEIRDQRLYREDYSTFKEYLGARWGFKLSRAYQLIGMAGVARNLSTVVEVSKLNERQLRPLVGKAPELQRAAWLKGGEGKEGRPRTGKDIQAAVQALIQPADVSAEITPPPELVQAALGLAQSLDRFEAVARLHPDCQSSITDVLEKHCRDAKAFLRTLEASAN
jgi:hypothetical protein